VPDEYRAITEVYENRSASQVWFIRLVLFSFNFILAIRKEM
jgi:hypothetical protein